jgi:DNA-binding MarR family transcriptional regulator
VARAELLGTQLRHLLESLDGAVAEVYRGLGMPGFRPRYTPILRVLATGGPQSIRDLAKATSVTHSAASQTVAQLAREGYVELEPGQDARQRIVHLTPAARSVLPKVEAEWAATTAAASQLEDELPFSLSELLAATTAALERRSFRERIASNMKPPQDEPQQEVRSFQ